VVTDASGRVNDANQPLLSVLAGVEWPAHSERAIQRDQKIPSLERTG